MRATKWVAYHPTTTISLVLILTIFFILNLRNLQIETDISGALPKNLPVKKLFDEVSEMFPSKDLIFIALQKEPLFTPQVVSGVKELTDSLLRIRGVHDVLSPTNVEIVEATEEGIAIVPAYEEGEDAISLLRSRLISSEFRGNLISNDGKAFGIMVFLKSKVRTREVAKEVLDLVERFKERTGIEIYASGRPIIEYVLAKGLLRDVHVFFMLVIVVITAFLFIIFGSLRGVLLPFMVVIVSVLWTMGFMALIGIKFSHSTEFMPVLLISIGIADGIHILHTYYQKSGEIKEKKKLVISTMEVMNLPVIMTSLTTAVAFLALGIAGFKSLRELGTMTAFGVIVAMFLSLYLIPAFLSLLKIPEKPIGEERMRWLHKFLPKVGRFVIEKKYPLLFLLFVFLFFIALGYPKIKVENSTIENFHKGSKLRKAYEFINKHFSGSEVLLLVVKGKEGSLKSSSLLREIDGFKSYMLRDKDVGDVISLADIVKRMNLVLHGNDSSYYRIPDTLEEEDGRVVRGDDLISQYLALYSLSSSPGRLESFVTDDYRAAKIQVFLREGRRTVIKRIDELAKQYIRKDFRSAEEVELTGTPEIFLVINDLVVSGQAKSILFSLFLVFLLVMVSFRSWVAGVYGIIPLLFAMLVHFGVLGWLGIYANLENMITSNIAIGVGVDYMIHFIHRFRKSYKEAKGDFVLATEKTMFTSGAAIFLNAIGVALGFSTIISSSFRSVSQMGFLISLAMVSTCFAALTILPLLISVTKPSFLEKGGKG